MRTVTKLSVFLVFGLLLTLIPSISYADRDNHHHQDYRDHDRSHDRSFVGLSFSFWPERYHYREVVYRTPALYQPIYINGTMYYLNNGNYYYYNGYNYQLIPAPVTQVIQSPTIIVTQPAVVAPPIAPVNVTPLGDESFDLSIPNNQGGYTSVTIRRTDKGFLGPQGELYREFPKVVQLKAMYGK